MSKSKVQHADHLLKAFIEYCNENGLHYMVIVGKEGVCSRYMRGDQCDLTSMVSSMVKNNPKFGELLKNAFDNLENKLI